MQFNVKEMCYKARNQGRRDGEAPCKIFRHPWKNVLHTVQNH